MTSAPPQIQGLRLVLRDGTEFPVEAVFMGYDGEGIALWRAVVPVAKNSDVTHLVADRWPPRCSIEFEVID